MICQPFCVAWNHCSRASKAWSWLTCSPAMAWSAILLPARSLATILVALVPMPSIWPETSASGEIGWSSGKRANLMEDDPALIVRMACFMSGGSSLAVGVGNQCGDDARCGSGFGGVGAAGQDDGHLGAEHDAGGQGVGQVFQLLGDHVARFEIGNDEDFSVAGDGGLDALGLGGDDGDCIVEGQRAVEDAALD